MNVRAHHVAHYAWLRLVRSHYLKALLAASFFVAVAAFGGSGGSDSVMARMTALEVAIKASRWFVWLAAIWIGLSCITDEINAQTARTLFTKPVRRVEVVLGLMGGGALYLTLVTAVNTLLIFVIAVGRDIPVSLGSFALLQVSMLIPVFAVLALTMVLSLVFSKPIAGFLMIFLAQENVWDVLATTLNASQRPDWFKVPGVFLLKLCYLISPTYHRFIQEYQEFIQLEFPWGEFVFHTAAIGFYVGAAALLATFILRRKDV
ncbi:MAG: ABC transporter permease subunit [Deltaproteobacteria bacterium]|nr:ABC transporter permease subunit [Deltaproteobacteria bacterium]MCB9490312.1 ABC transporter permease subunit [Deltaproteobacteria bacterium]